MTVRDPIEYDDAPPVKSASIAASICASRLAADAMPRSLRDGVACQQCRVATLCQRKKAAEINQPPFAFTYTFIESTILLFLEYV